MVGAVLLFLRLITKMFSYLLVSGSIVQHICYQRDTRHAFLPIPLTLVWYGLLPVNPDEDFFLSNKLILFVRIDPWCFQYGRRDAVHRHVEVFHVHRF